MANVNVSYKWTDSSTGKPVTMRVLLDGPQDVVASIGSAIEKYLVTTYNATETTT
jgi:hypothetical protein